MNAKRIIAAALVLVTALALTACGCRHQWEAANCNAPKTCKICGETVGNRMGHHWSNATCTENKTCTRCGAIGEASQGHSWVEATTETPKTCRICSATEGDRIITDGRFHTADTKDFAGTWTGQLLVPCKDLGYTGINTPMAFNITVTFGKAGEFTSKVELASGLPMMNEVIRLQAEDLYASYAATNMDKAAADAAMKKLMGLTVAEYAAYCVQQKNYTYKDPITSQMSGVYYVQEGQAHVAAQWTDDMTKTYGTIQDGQLQWTDVASGRSCTLTQKTA